VVWGVFGRFGGAGFRHVFGLGFYLFRGGEVVKLGRDDLRQDDDLMRF